MNERILQVIIPTLTEELVRKIVAEEFTPSHQVMALYRKLKNAAK